MSVIGPSRKSLARGLLGTVTSVPPS
jgi:hypothetical protein